MNEEAITNVAITKQRAITTVALAHLLELMPEPVAAAFEEAMTVFDCDQEEALLIPKAVAMTAPYDYESENGSDALSALIDDGRLELASDDDDEDEDESESDEEEDEEEERYSEFHNWDEIVKEVIGGIAFDFVEYGRP